MVNYGCLAAGKCDDVISETQSVKRNQRAGLFRRNDGPRAMDMFLVAKARAIAGKR